MCLSLLIGLFSCSLSVLCDKAKSVRIASIMFIRAVNAMWICTVKDRFKTTYDVS